MVVHQLLKKRGLESLNVIPGRPSLDLCFQGKFLEAFHTNGVFSHPSRSVAVAVLDIDNVKKKKNEDHPYSSLAAYLFALAQTQPRNHSQQQATIQV